MTTTEPTTPNSGFLAESPRAEQLDPDQPNPMVRVIRHSAAYTLTMAWIAFVAGLVVGPSFWRLVLELS